MAARVLQLAAAIITTAHLKTMVSTGGGSSYGNQPVQTTPGSTGNLVTYIISDLKIRMQVPAGWQGPSSCVNTDSAGVISIPSTCNPVWIAENGYARVKINGETLLAEYGLEFR